MRKCMMPKRVTLWKGNEAEGLEINYEHILSDGFGIPAIVRGCPIAKKFPKYEGVDEYGNKVKGISFDDCSDCQFFEKFGFGQEIYCTYGKNPA